jgi:uncharacterized protein YndB with AHSA1/START domain
MAARSDAASIGPLVVEQVFDAPVATVWSAITDSEAIKQWFLEFEGFQAKVGCEFQFTGEDKGVKFLHHCKVMEVMPEKRLAYSWRYDGYEGNSLVTFELFPEGNGTRLKLTHAGLETFPKHPSFVRANFERGWTEIIGSLLKSFLEKQQAKS